MRALNRLMLSVGMSLLVAGSASAGDASATPLDASSSKVAARAWATPVDRSLNLYRMAPNLYRSALPTASSVPLLRQLQVGTVISFIKDDDREWIGGYDARLVSLPMHADRVDDADVLEALRAIQVAEAQGPVLIHCKHGRDRTGLVAAMYRTVIQGWSKEEALDEMKRGGFGDPRFMDDAIAYIEQADVGDLREALARGDCDTSVFATCHVAEWFASAF